MEDFKIMARVVGVSILTALILMIGCKLLDTYYPMTIQITETVQPHAK